MASIYKRNKIYWIAYKDRFGKRIIESTKLTDKEAAQRLKRHYGALEQSYKLYGTPLQGDIRLSDWQIEFQRYRADRVSPATASRDRQAVESLLNRTGDQFLSRISRTDIEGWFSEILKTHAPAGANCLLRHVKIFFNAAVKLRHLSESPAADVRSVRENIQAPRILSQEEVGRLLEVCPVPWAKLIRAAIYTGGRSGELCRLRCSDFNPDIPGVTFQSEPENPTKSKKYRIVPVPDHSVDFFRELIREAGGGVMLRTESGGAWKVQWITHGFAKWARRADVNCTFHDLRRTYGGWLVMFGADLVTVQQNLGHADIQTTIRNYAGILDRHKCEQVNKMPVV